MKSLYSNLYDPFYIQNQESKSILMQSVILEEHNTSGSMVNNSSLKYLKKIEKKAANVNTVDVKSSDLKSESNIHKGVVYNQ